MSSLQVIILSLLTLFVNFSTSYRILVIYPSPSYSHQIVQLAVSEGLADAGHQITLITPLELKTNSNITQIVVQPVADLWKNLDFSKGLTDKQFADLITNVVPRIMHIILMDPKVIKLLKNEEKLKYDAVIVENLGYIPSHAFAEHFNATLIGLTSLEMFPEMHMAMGNPGHPLLHRSYLFKTPSEGFFNRILSFYSTLRHHFWFYQKYIPANDWVLEQHFDKKWKSRDLLSRMDFAIEGQSAVLANTRPILPNTVQISFLHVKEVKPLPADIQKFLDNSKHGVIYVSFGSNVKSSSLKKETLNELIETFKAVKYDILWKFEADNLENKPKNVKIGKWMPQQDILAHKNVKLFIMQGGIQSLEETIARGVPVIVIPFFSDQEANAEKVIDLQIGERLNIADLSKELLLKKINLVIEGPYKENIKKLGDVVRDTPMPPVKTAVWWIEYAIRNRGAAHLKYKGASMSFSEFFLLDVILFHLSLFIVLTCASYKILVIHPTPSISHQLAPHAIIKGLAAAGHEVTFVTSIPIKTDSPNIRHVHLEYLHELWKKFDFSNGMGILEFFNLIQTEAPPMVDSIFSFPAVKSILNRENGEEFDAVMVENVGYVPLNAVAEHFNATLIAITTMETPPQQLRAVGNPVHPILQSAANLGLPKNPSLLQKIASVYASLIMDAWYYNVFIPSNDWVIRKHFDTKLSGYELMQRVDLTIEAQSPILDNTKPLLPNTVQISSLHIQPVKELPIDLKNYFDQSKNGVVYVSFGSNVKSASMSHDKREALLKTFAALPYDILWKFESDQITNLTKNVKISKWLPQQDLLAHKNLKAFVMQGGVQSLEEAISRAVPMVVVPFFGDQEYNANKVQDLGIGLKTELTAESLTSAILEVVQNPRYKQKVTTLSKRLTDTMKPPVETAVWWIEYAIRNKGAEHMQYQGKHLSSFEYFLLDIIFIHVFLLSLFIFVVVKFCCRRKKSETKTTKLKRK
ncbi:UDP-glucosyltransferase 2-like [Culicoides brevitarsis]|uniref:UDP-glucosyltransferase 2-like n=1 Tax=Culicoides brevitarsis TaxID=469753 RepID=UPI00307B2600